MRSCIKYWHIKVYTGIFTNIDIEGGYIEDYQCGRHRSDNQTET